MSCGAVLAISLMLSNPAVAEAAAQPPAVVGAPVSVASEPLFAEIVSLSSALHALVDLQISAGSAERPDFATSEPFAVIRRGAVILAEKDMQAHLVLKERGTDGDLKCILRGISEDIPKKVAAVEAATSPALRATALSELSYLLNDNVEVITTPPQPDAQSGVPAG